MYGDMVSGTFDPQKEIGKLTSKNHVQHFWTKNNILFGRKNRAFGVI